MIFLDSNIPMYVAGSAHPNKEPARRILEMARDGRIVACTSAEVLQEILCRYHAMRRRDLAEQVYALFVAICPDVLPVRLEDTDRARLLLATVEGVGVRDAIHAAVMLNRGIGEIATFDRRFDQIPGIHRFLGP